MRQEQHLQHEEGTSYYRAQEDPSRIDRLQGPMSPCGKKHVCYFVFSVSAQFREVFNALARRVFVVAEEEAAAVLLSGSSCLDLCGRCCCRRHRVSTQANSSGTHARQLEK